ncbi:MAG TPA: hypothetical protein DF712_20410 [Balneola sp.]|nr:hypothetical protein [Balneola sp.]|tara:strand:+ start:558 stop:848 length:291 start_codon:yes stop_codon:yes gene_type:complete
MFDIDVTTNIGSAMVYTSEEKGHSIETIAEMAVNKILTISDSAPQPIRDQAKVFKKDLETVIVHYMKKAVTEDRATVSAMLKKTGYSELAEHLRRL